MDDTNKLIVTALTGGLAGSVITQLLNITKEWCLKPKLQCVLSKRENGCIATTANGKYIRLKVKNTGRTIAKDVQVMISINGNQTEVYDSIWSGLEKNITNIPSNTFRYCDVLLVDTNNRINVVKFANTISEQVTEKNLDFSISITASNAKTETATAIIELSNSGIILKLNIK